VDDSGEINVAVCKAGDALPPLSLEPLSGAEATYDANAGVRVSVTGYTAEHGVTPVPFNPVEFGLTVVARSGAEGESLTVLPQFIEACQGNVRVTPGAQVSVAGVMDPELVAATCAPGSVDKGRCAIKDGVSLQVFVTAALQLQGFVKPTHPLHLRADPTAASASLALIPVERPVELTGELRDGFYSVVFDGKKGWVSRDYVVSLVGKAVTTDALNVREVGSTQSPVLEVIPAKTTVVLTGMGEGQFVGVQVGNAKDGYRYGMVSGKFLTDAVYDPSFAGAGAE
jgi:hypothetical protein